ncbi:type II secretion system protein GspL [Rhodanobacter sp. C01]|uniref:PilN domain-containing protein n=1 Tax=Rhodanobacter sp. C01 TaxID=1945856 RepID=UPI000987078B|nr:type II secretion system protein GspL [Rhodanobacter sp. C01]OOG49566.1 fimbrial assembly protein [Rhodanobacter sp. C01]
MSNTATQSLRPLMDRLRRGWRASPLPPFLGWWGGELRGLLPLRWRHWFGGGADWHLLQRTGMQWTLRRAGHGEVLARWDDGAETPAVGDGQMVLKAALQKVDREDLRLALLLPSATVLRRTLALPTAARDNLQQVMAFEMDRQTPFSAAQVYYAVRELSAPAGGRFQAELVVVTRDTLDPLLLRLRELGVSIDAVDLAVGQDRLGVNLLPTEQTPRHVRPRRRLNLALAGGCVLLLVMVLGQWLHNRQAALEQMRSEVESMRGDAQQVAALRTQLQDNTGAASFLVRRKKDTSSMLGVLQDITQRLPDSAWLERFNVDNTGQVGMQGQSQQAVKLLDVLKDSRLITNASFQGSIQPDPTSGKERFYLTAQLATARVKPAAAVPAGDGGAP